MHCHADPLLWSHAGLRPTSGTPGGAAHPHLLTGRCCRSYQHRCHPLCRPAMSREVTPGWRPCRRRGRTGVPPARRIMVGPRVRPQGQSAMANSYAHLTIDCVRCRWPSTPARAPRARTTNRLPAGLGVVRSARGWCDDGASNSLRPCAGGRACGRPYAAALRAGDHTQLLTGVFYLCGAVSGKGERP